MKSISRIAGILLCCLIISSLQVSAQSIVNIESKRLVTDTTGWAGNADLFFRLSKNVQTEYALSTSTHLQYKTDRDLFLLLVNGQLVEAGKEKFVNTGFIHFRYNRKMGSLLRWEAFTQLQYNKILSVNQRFLLGTGPRLKLVSNDNFTLYQGTLYMYEYEEVVNPEVTYRDQRLSAYVSSSWHADEQFHISATWYYQPLIDKFSDFRVAGQLSLELSISDRVSFVTAFNHLYDSEPPENVPKDVFNISNGLRVRF